MGHSQVACAVSLVYRPAGAPGSGLLRACGTGSTPAQLLHIQQLLPLPGPCLCICEMSAVTSRFCAVTQNEVQRGSSDWRRQVICPLNTLLVPRGPSRLHWPLPAPAKPTSPVHSKWQSPPRPVCGAPMGRKGAPGQGSWKGECLPPPLLPHGGSCLRFLGFLPLACYVTEGGTARWGGKTRSLKPEHRP